MSTVKDAIKDIMKDIIKNSIHNLNNLDVFLGTLSETISIYIPFACLILIVTSPQFPLYIILLTYALAFILYYTIALMNDDSFNSSCIKEGQMFRAFLQKYI